MRRDRPSRTAAWVAACRTLGAWLPAEARLADDPYGALFAGKLAPAVAAIAALPAPVRARLVRTSPLAEWVAYLQVRTRVLDDALLDFARGGGRQVVLLGAGFDCRALRFAAELASATVFEVDHPATQADKRARLDAAGARAERARYLAWDFETEPTSALAPALARLGHDAREPTLTIWEGVTMYLTEPAIESTLGAVRRFAPAGSPLAFTYFDRRRLAAPSAGARLLAEVVARAGEPFRFGWVPDELDAWLEARGFTLEEDRTEAEAARDLLPPAFARKVPERGRHLALARVAVAAGR